jgi:ATP-dependent helicase HrpB
MHPRLAHMVLKAKALGLAGLASDLAALLEERDVLRAGRGCRDGDIRLRVEALRTGEGFDPRHGLSLDRGALARARQSAKEWRRRLGLRAGQQQGAANQAGLLLAFAYPDRIARRRPGAEPRYAMTSGRGAVFADHEPLTAEEWLVLAELDGDRREARIFMAAPLGRAEIEEHFAAEIETVIRCQWEGREEVVLARRQRLLWGLALEDLPLRDADPAALAAAMAAGIRAMGLACLPWTPDLERLRRRVAFIAGIEPEAEWPDLSDQALTETLEQWLAPFLTGITRRAHLTRLDLAAALGGRLSWEQRRRLDELAPTHMDVPSGSRVAIDYSGDTPVLAVRLQEMFGCAETPRIAQGKVALLLHLLSPARRPVQVTRDLASFWANAYRQVRADIRGQYPKHWWPDDPMQAEPTARIKPRK